MRASAAISQRDQLSKALLFLLSGNVVVGFALYYRERARMNTAYEEELHKLDAIQRREKGDNKQEPQR
jgi:hypothetical protein